MIVTTEITAVTPTIMPTRVNAVRNLFWRRLLAATLNASHRVEMRSPMTLRKECRGLRIVDISSRCPGRRLVRQPTGWMDDSPARAQSRLAGAGRPKVRWADASCDP